MLPFFLIFGVMINPQWHVSVQTCQYCKKKLFAWCLENHTLTETSEKGADGQIAQNLHSPLIPQLCYRHPLSELSMWSRLHTMSPHRLLHPTSHQSPILLQVPDQNPCTVYSAVTFLFTCKDVGDAMDTESPSHHAP